MRERGIIIRFDDICPTMNWTQFQRAKSLLDKNGKNALLGVIPECKDPDLAINSSKDDFWEIILALQKAGYSVAMHGLYHMFDISAKGIVTKKKQSEFAGHSYEEQYEKIKKGKDILKSHGIFTDIFFAPAHSYDDNTLKALYANGFKYISDGLSKKPYKRNGIVCLPCRSAGVPKIGGRGYYTVVIHAHEWVRPEKAQAWSEFCDIINNYSEDIISFEEFATIPLGNKLYQTIIEKCYYFWLKGFKPLLAIVKRILINIFRKS